MAPGNVRLHMCRAPVGSKEWKTFERLSVCEWTEYIGLQEYHSYTNFAADSLMQFLNQHNVHDLFEDGVEGKLGALRTATDEAGERFVWVVEPQWVYMPPPNRGIKTTAWSLLGERAVAPSLAQVAAHANQHCYLIAGQAPLTEPIVTSLTVKWHGAVFRLRVLAKVVLELSKWHKRAIERAYTPGGLGYQSVANEFSTLANRGVSEP